MTMLVIEVDDPERNVREQFNFAASPVRIGRSQLNELPLPFEFVSSWHGVLTFDDEGCEYVDLGSTNGTYVAQQRLPKNTRHPISETTVLAIGRLKLSARRSLAKAPARQSYAFDVAQRSQRDDHRPQAAFSPSSTARARGELEGAYLAYRSAWHDLYQRLEQEYRALPEKGRARWASEARSRFPALSQEASFRTLVASESRPSADAAQGSIAQLVATLSGDSMEHLSRMPAAQLEQRLAALIERSLSAFLELRTGHENFLKEMGLGTVHRRASDGLSEVSTRSDALRYLLGSGATLDRLDELARAYTDIMTHQVALLNGVLAGAREMLASLDSQPVKRRPPRIFRWFSWLRHGSQPWTEERKMTLRELQEEGVLTSALFGRAFARAYAASMGAHSANPRSPRRHSALPRDAA